MAAASPWVILGRLAFVWPDDEEEAEGVAVALAAPPRVSTLTMPSSVHPHPGAGNPYILAAEHAGLLVHLYGSSSGFDLGDDPRGALVMFRNFNPVAGSKHDEQAPGSIVRIPDRIELDTPGLSRKLGLVSHPSSGGVDYAIAELRLAFGADQAKLIYFRSGASAWVSKDLQLPHPHRTSLRCGWRTDDVIAHEGKLWWVSLRRGLLSCDPFADEPVLHYDELPVAIAAPYKYKSQRELEADRCVRTSRGKLRFVEITRVISDPVGATMVVMFTLCAGPSGMSWKLRYAEMLQQIWDSPSYKATGMPQEVPMLAVVHPNNPDVVYFVLRQYLFGVNVPEQRVMEFIGEQYELFAGLQPPASLIWWRYVLPWELPTSFSEGQHPNESGTLLRLKSALLRRKDALKRHVEVQQIVPQKTTKELQQSLLLREQKKDDSRWDKVQVMILTILVSGLTLLFPLLPWLPQEFLSFIIVGFSVVVGFCCVALPCVLFSTKSWQMAFGESVARVGFLCFSLFALYCLYRMSVHPVLDMAGKSLAPPPTQVNPADTWGMFWNFIYIGLALGIAMGQIGTWICNCGADR